MLKVFFRILVLVAGVIAGLMSVAPALLLLALDLQSWGDAKAAGAAIPSIEVLVRLLVHGVGLGAALIAILGGVYAVLRPRRAGALLLVAALCSVPTLTYFIEWNLRMGIPVPVLLPTLLLVVASALMFIIVTKPQPAPDAHEETSPRVDGPQQVAADVG